MAPTRQEDEWQDVDPFLQMILRGVAWTQRNQTVVIAAAVVLIVGLGGFLYYRNFQQQVREEAATQLQQIESQMQTAGAPDTLILRLQDFVDRYGDTRYAHEARILLARVRSEQGSPDRAVELLRPVSNRPVDTPLGYAANQLLAHAYAGSGDTARALEVLARLADGARFEFQRTEARAARAQLLAARGDLQEAERLYRAVVDSTASDAPDAPLYRSRLGEIQARLSSASSGAGGAG